MTYFGEAIYLKVIWAQPSDYFFNVTHADSATNPHVANPTAFAGTSALSSLYLYLNVEQNQVVQQAIMDKYKSGTLKYNFNYVHTQIHSKNGARTHNVSVRYSLPHGKKLKKIVWIPLHGVNTKEDRYDSSVFAADGTTVQKVTSFYSLIYSVTTSQYDLFTAQGNEWLEAKNKLRGSAILSSGEFYYNYSHTQYFTGSLSSDINSNLNDGVSLENEVIYDLQIEALAALNHYLFGVTQRTITITPNGVTMV
eukprot:Lithocolla_globosa_v1_NODE_1490_length_2537_cov_627.806205.p2 type:complete len:252 gc:universal NODE_1490_length_2537_cov_627.806205:793-1548(+)